MIPTSFQNITRRLDINKSERDTTNDKVLLKSRAIRKLNYEFVIPETIIDVAGFGIDQAGALMHQYNYTAPGDFRILSYIIPVGSFNAENFAYVCIRFREEGVVTRYRLAVSGIAALEQTLNGFAVMNAPMYDRQLIRKNFAIEIWTVLPDEILIHIGPYTIITGRLSIPNNPDELKLDIDELDSVSRDDLSQSMPETLPTAYGDRSQWLNNT